MRRVKLIKRPLQSAQQVGAEIWRGSKRRQWLLFYKHRCDDRWYEELLDDLSLKGKRLDPSRARRLLIAALMKGEESDEDQR